PEPARGTVVRTPELPCGWRRDWTEVQGRGERVAGAGPPGSGGPRGRRGGGDELGRRPGAPVPEAPVQAPLRHVAQAPLPEPRRVPPRRPPEAGQEQPAPRPEDAPRLVDGPRPPGAVGDVVDGQAAQDDVERAVPERQGPQVAGAQGDVPGHPLEGGVAPG